MVIKKCLKSVDVFLCESCNFKCSKKSNFDAHLNTAKHKMITNDNKKNAKENEKKFRCVNCDKGYKHASGLSRHMKACNIINIEPVKTDEVVSELIKQNHEFKVLIVEQQKENHTLHQKILEVAKEGKTIHNSQTNNQINNFNLSVFLNEECKNAVNLIDFISSLRLSLKDVESMGKLGYVEGMGNILVKALNDLDVNERPIHCTDIKRETVYVKDSNKWSNEDEHKTHLRKAVRIVADKNKEQVHHWREQNPNYDILDTPECDKFFEYTKASNT